jgi:hypothetical protein
MVQIEWIHNHLNHMFRLYMLASVDRTPQIMGKPRITFIDLIINESLSPLEDTNRTV